MKKLLVTALFLGTIANAGFFDSVVSTVSSVTSTTQENKPLIDEVKKETGLSTTQTTGALGAIMAYAGNNLSKSDYNSITDKVPGLSSLTSSPTISPIVSTLTNSEMVQSTLKGLGVDPALLKTIIPIVVNYVSKSGGESSGDMLSSALSGLLK